MAHLITERYEYDYCISRGYEPLLDVQHFQMDINLRIDLQREIFGHTIFGRGNIPAANQRFYKWVWDKMPHICEETMQPLHNYSASFISHILSKGAHPDIAHDPRNINILSFRAHEKWEFGKRCEMRINEKNIIRIELLKRDYSL